MIPTSTVLAWELDSPSLSTLPSLVVPGTDSACTRIRARRLETVSATDGGRCGPPVTPRRAHSLACAVPRTHGARVRAPSRVSASGRRRRPVGSRSERRNYMKRSHYTDHYTPHTNTTQQARHTPRDEGTSHKSGTAQTLMSVDGPAPASGTPPQRSRIRDRL